MVSVVPAEELMVLVPSEELVNQLLTLPVTAVVMEMVMALALVVVMATPWEARLLAPAVKLRLVKEVFRMLAPPPPEVPLLYVTVMVTGAALVGDVGVRMTVAWCEPPLCGANARLKLSTEGVVVVPVTLNHATPAPSAA